MSIAGNNMQESNLVGGIPTPLKNMKLTCRYDAPSHIAWLIGNSQSDCDNSQKIG